MGNCGAATANGGHPNDRVARLEDPRIIHLDALHELRIAENDGFHDRRSRGQSCWIGLQSADLKIRILQGCPRLPRHSPQVALRLYTSKRYAAACARTRRPRSSLGAPRHPALAATVNPGAVLTYVWNNPGSSCEQIAEEMATDTATLLPVLRELIEAGEVKASGKARGTLYATV